MALQALDGIWRNQGNRTVQLSKGTVLWHGGIIGPHHAMTGDRLLWTTRNEEQKDYYDGQARCFAKTMKLNPYRLELMLNTDVHCADFNAFSLLNFTMQYCNYNHDEMSRTLKQWLIHKGLGGIVAINGGPDEVVVYNPHLTLDISHMMPIPPSES